MPYSSLSEVPGGFKSVAPTPGGKPIPLTLSQVNWLARVYDGLVADGKSKSSAAQIAKAQFRKAHTVRDGKWVKKSAEAYDKLFNI